MLGNSSKNSALASPRSGSGRGCFYRFISFALSLLIAFSCFSAGIFPIKSAAVNAVGDVETPFNDGLSVYVVQTNDPDSVKDDKENDSSKIVYGVDKAAYGLNGAEIEGVPQFYLKIHNHTGRRAKILRIDSEGSAENPRAIVLNHIDWKDKTFIQHHAQDHSDDSEAWYVKIMPVPDNEPGRDPKDNNPGLDANALYDLTITYELEGVFDANKELVKFEQPFYIYVYDSSEFKDSQHMTVKNTSADVDLDVWFSTEYGAFRGGNQPTFSGDVSDVDEGFSYSYYIDSSAVPVSAISDLEHRVQWQDLGFRMYASNNDETYSGPFTFNPRFQFVHYGKGGMIELGGTYSNKTFTDKENYDCPTFGIGDANGNTISSRVPGDYDTYFSDVNIATPAKGRSEPYIAFGNDDGATTTSSPGVNQMRRIWNDDGRGHQQSIYNRLVLNAKNANNAYFPFFGYIFKPDANKPNDPATIQFGGISDNALRYPFNSGDDKGKYLGMVWQKGNNDGSGAPGSPDNPECSSDMQGVINVYVSDKSKLRGLLTAPDFAPLSSRYSSEVWNAYKISLMSAIETLANPFKKEGEVVTATEDLKAAMVKMGYNPDYEDHSSAPDSFDMSVLNSQFITIEHIFHDGDKQNGHVARKIKYSTDFEGNSVDISSGADGKLPDYILISKDQTPLIADSFYITVMPEELGGKNINRRTDLAKAIKDDFNRLDSSLVLADVKCYYWSVSAEKVKEDVDTTITSSLELLGDYWELPPDFLDKFLGDNGALKQLLNLKGEIDGETSSYSDQPESDSDFTDYRKKLSVYLDEIKKLGDTDNKVLNGFVSDYSGESSFDVLNRGEGYAEKIANATKGAPLEYYNFKVTDISKRKSDPASLISNTVKGEFGTFTLDGSTITYKPTKVATDVDRIYFTVSYTAKINKQEGGSSISPGITTVSELVVIPSTVVYYEDTLTDQDESPIKYTSGKANGAVTEWTQVYDSSADSSASNKQDWTPPGQDDLYGSDSNYGNSANSMYSMSSAHKVTVSAKNNPNKTYSGSDGNSWPEATLTFTGTGYDIISFISKDTGVVQVDLYKGGAASGEPVESKLIDTFSAYSYDPASGKWSVAGDGIPLYQVPIVSRLGLDYDTYTVKITPKYSKAFDHMSDGDGGSYDFYLDGFRVYNPTGLAKGKAETGVNSSGVDQGTILAKYKDDGEIVLGEQSVRDIIVDSGKLGVTGELDSGVFIQGMGNASFEDFKKYGPKNELYLRGKFGNSQAIAFSPELSGFSGGEPASISIKLSMHVVDETPASVKFATFDSETASSVVTWTNPITVKSATTLYFKLSPDVVQKDSSSSEGGNLKYQPIVVQCTGGTVSLCNIKITTSEIPTGTSDSDIKVNYSMSKKDIETAIALVNGAADSGTGSGNGEGTFAPAMIELPQGLKSDTGRIEGIIKTSSEVASVEVNGVKAELAGEKDGVKEWKYTFESSHAGEKTFKVTAYNSAGQKSPEFTMTVTFAQGVTDDSTEPKSFIEKLVAFIRNIMGLIDRLLEGFMVLL